MLNGLVKTVQWRGGRVFVVGDIHGDYELFMSKLIELDFDREKDQVISVGDLVDRRHQNEQCVNLLDEEWFDSVKGNHEDFCVLGYHSADIAEIHSDPRNGGAWFYKLSEERQLEIAKKFQGLPLAIEIEYNGNLYGFTHAGMPLIYWDDLKRIDNPRLHIAGRELMHHLIWSREGYDTLHKDTQEVQGVRALFHGHTPTGGVIEKRGNEIYVDFGACFGYDLCVIELEKACDFMEIP